MTPRTVSKSNAPVAAGNARPLSLVLTALRRHGPVAMVSSLILCGLAMAGVMMTFEPVYEAKSFLHVIQNPEYFQIVPERSQSRSTDSKSELAPLLSEIVLRQVMVDEQVLRQPSFRSGEMTTAKLRKMLRFQSAGGQEHYEVVATSPDPREAAVVVTKATDAFLDFFRNYRNTRLLELSESLSSEIRAKSQQIDDLNRELANMVRDMQGTTQNTSLFDPEGQFLNELKKSRAALEADMHILQQERAGLQESLDSQEVAVDEAVVNSFVEQSADIRNLRQRLQTLLDQRGANTGRGSGHPEVLELERQIGLMSQQIERSRTTLAQQFRAAEAAKLIQQMQTRIREIDQELARFKLRAEFYDGEISKQLGEIASANQKRAQFEVRQSDLERVREEHKRLVDAESAIQLRKLSLPYQISKSNAEVVVPTEPVEAYPLRLLAMASAVALGLPFGLAFLWELRTKRVTSGEDIVQSQGVSLIGEVTTLPAVARKPQQRMSRNMARRLRLYQESVDNVSALLLVDQERPYRTIALTSASTHEGKSTLSSQLAISIARSNHGSVLLIDTDLRSPAQHRLFDMDLQPGLAEILEQKADWRTVARPTRIDNLQIITAGRVKSNPRRCFSGTGWESLLAELQSHFDYVIVDTPPVLATSESMMICKTCSATLLCLLRDVSRADAVQRAHRRLTSADVHVLGCVMSGVPYTEYAYRYGSYGYNLTR